MWQGAMILLTVTAVLILYLTNRHQLLIGRTLPRYLRYPAVLLLAFTLAGWLLFLTPSAAFFIWLVTIMLTLLLTPFACYLIRVK